MLLHTQSGRVKSSKAGYATRAETAARPRSLDNFNIIVSGTTFACLAHVRPWIRATFACRGARFTQGDRVSWPWGAGRGRFVGAYGGVSGGKASLAALCCGHLEALQEATARAPPCTAAARPGGSRCRCAQARV